MGTPSPRAKLKVVCRKSMDITPLSLDQSWQKDRILGALPEVSLTHFVLVLREIKICSGSSGVYWPTCPQPLE
jgi:hypothetical protein